VLVPPFLNAIANFVLLLAKCAGFVLEFGKVFQYIIEVETFTISVNNINALK
jgi:hypothetical protein